MSSPNKATAIIYVDYADESMNQYLRRCRFIAHTTNLSALPGINPSYFMTCLPERNSVILAIPALVILSEAKDLTPVPRCFVALSMTMLSLTAVRRLMRTPPIYRPSLVVPISI